MQQLVTMAYKTMYGCSDNIEMFIAIYLINTSLYDEYYIYKFLPLSTTLLFW